MATIRMFLRDDRGATAIEYALIAVLIAVGIIGGVTATGTSLTNSYGKVATGLK